MAVTQPKPRSTRGPKGGATRATGNGRRMTNSTAHRRINSNSAAYQTVVMLAKDPSLTIQQVEARLKAKKIDAPTQVRSSYRHFRRVHGIMQDAGLLKK